MTLNFKLQKEISSMCFGLGIDFENKSIMIGLFYWCFSITSIKITSDKVFNPNQTVRR